MTGSPRTDLGILRRYIARMRWEVQYDTALQMRDWQTCEILRQDRPEPLPWLLEKFVVLALGSWIKNG